MSTYDVIIIGAGAAGLMCAIESAKRGKKTLILDHAEKAGEKIRISGGGRCNFTNLHTSPANFISQNEHFCKSALKRFSQHDFIKLIEGHNIKWHEKTLGQLFCDDSAKQIVNMLLNELADANAEIKLETKIESIVKDDNFTVTTSNGTFTCHSLVIATGGPSIPKMGATGFAYDIAKQFDINVIKPRPALVPLTFNERILEGTKELAGVSVDPVEVSIGKRAKFREALLFTHKGLSGPAILQISSYWNIGYKILINLLPDKDMFEELKTLKKSNPKIALHNALSQFLPKRLAELIAKQNTTETSIANLPDKKLKTIANVIHSWQIEPTGTEGFKIAEVTRGGIDTDEVSSKTFESKKIAGLYFIGEALDVTGQLGGHNFQWAWSSGYCAGQFV